MKWVSRYLNVMFLLHSVVGVVPVPSNLSVSSVNFLHILRWDAGPAAPPGVQYKVYSRLSGKKEKQMQRAYTTNATSLQLKLDKYKYYLTVQAFYNGTWSPESEEVPFTPFEQNFSTVPVFLGTTVGLLIFCIGTLMTLTYCLYYTGLLCKLRATLPRALIMALIHAKYLPVEEISPDLISIGSDIQKQNYTSALYPAHKTTYSGSVEEKVAEEEENKESDIYINRGSENSSGESTCRYSWDILRTFLSVRSHTEADTLALSSDKSGTDQLGTRVENEDTSMSWQPETEIKEQLIFQLEGEMNENTFNMSESINLLSVTLTSSITCRKEELDTEKSLVDSLRLSDKEPSLIATKQNLCNTDVQNGLNELRSKKCTIFDEACSEYRCDDDETQEDLEEEQFLGYIER
ncbi:uncharacterized protein LOC133512212 isoform X4 [Syngnathoides biaculeatus]|uniref:uncharacterized protein LOC133512212 isoform X4 n=1 Tax=Syngnathoides biaculeatus TaxID=300417 RepID=UPI002ADDCFBD|nr:uncharacterized protein LOC133512212 isoform X4 [Syngnathoides biaculeatus]